jgi:hypothetical protein
MPPTKYVRIRTNKPTFFAIHEHKAVIIHNMPYCRAKELEPSCCMFYAFEEGETLFELCTRCSFLFILTANSNWANSTPKILTRINTTIATFRRMTKTENSQLARLSPRQVSWPPAANVTCIAERITDMEAKINTKGAKRRSMYDPVCQ